MIIVELPIIYAENIDEIMDGERMNIDTEVVESVSATTFFIPETALVRINEGTNEKRTSIFIDDISFNIDSPYEIVLELFKGAMKK